MIDIENIKKICKTYLCETRSSKKYDNYCLRCYMYTFPDKPISRNYKTKEFAVVEYVKQQFSEYNWISDKIISSGCSRRRPDLLLELEEQIIIIEIDENQHTDYDCSCENKRIMELSQDVGHKSIIFIRFNPDEYINKGEKNKSCWGLDQMVKDFLLLQKKKNGKKDQICYQVILIIGQKIIQIKQLKLFNYFMIYNKNPNPKTPNKI